MSCKGTVKDLKVSIERGYKVLLMYIKKRVNNQLKVSLMKWTHNKMQKSLTKLKAKMNSKTKRRNLKKQNNKKKTLSRLLFANISKVLLINCGLNSTQTTTDTLIKMKQKFSLEHHLMLQVKKESQMRNSKRSSSFGMKMVMARLKKTRWYSSS